MTVSLNLLTLPTAAPQRPMRQTQETIPNSSAERSYIKQLAVNFVEAVKPVPPVSMAELRVHSGAILEKAGIDLKFQEYAAVLLNNEMWRSHLAAVPFERRLLLVPKCLRPEATCPAPFDEFGLLCKQCGQCSLQDLQNEAERLGYAVLIAEGSALVMSIIQTGKIDAIVGVSCLSVLEKAFPYMESAAIPGVAIPLLQDDCKDTNLDIDWLWDVIHLTSDDQTYRLDLDSLRKEVDGWFSPASLDALCGLAPTMTEQIARDWMAKGGKRWRPFLTVCAWKALQDDPDVPLPDDLKRLAIAVECFHKASLVHDDIEDEDPTRYDEPTVHARHGIPVALNVGDYLLGEGYRLIGAVAGPAERVVKMLQLAAAGHRHLSLGQGAELCWNQQPAPLTSLQVLEIFRLKTAPAFEVALRLGAAFAGADDEVDEVLTRYSEQIGIAYQVRDDLEDFAGGEGISDAAALRPTLTMALALERAGGENKKLLQRAWRRDITADEVKRLHQLVAELDVPQRAADLLSAYKQEAIFSLRELTNPTLKGLLRRVVGKVFNDLEIKGWCREHEIANASGREARAEPTGAFG